MQTPPTYIQAGKLRQRIRILDPTVVTTAQDSFGGEIPGTDPAVIADNLPAAIEFVAAKLQYTASTFTSQVTHSVLIRWMPGIKAQQEVTFTDAEGRARVLQIQFIDNPDERNHFLILSCLERDQSARVLIS
jgi:SPP1 family predicted phage head-tail adaptor